MRWCCSSEPMLVIPTIWMFSVAVLGSGFRDYFEVLSRYSCRTYERCSDVCLRRNFSGLSRELGQRLHGQPLVRDLVVKAIESHLRTGESRRALALSFHGPTGVGKSFVSKLISKHLYYLGAESEFVHYFVASRDFPHSEEAYLSHYKDVINYEIRRRMRRCPYGLFVFDEIDKMPVHLIDVITSFLDFSSDESGLRGVDFTKAIFVFLSNSGERTITNFSLNAWRQGVDRSKFSLKQLERLLTNSIFNEEGGLFHSELIERDMISFIVPFLPLERNHLKDCVLDYINQRNYTLLFRNHAELMDFVMAVLDEIVFVPDRLQLFSSSGCKRVPQRVEYLIMDVEKRNFANSRDADEL